MVFSKDGDPTPARALPRDNPSACTQGHNKTPTISRPSSTPPSLRKCQLVCALTAERTSPKPQPAVISFEVYLGARGAQHCPSQLQRDAGFRGQSTTGFTSAASQQGPRRCFVPAKPHYQLSLCWPKAPATPSRHSPFTPTRRGNHSRHSGEERCHPSAERCSPLPAHRRPEQRWDLERWAPVGTTPPELCSPLAARCPVCPRHCKNRIIPSEPHASPEANFFSWQEKCW